MQSLAKTLTNVSSMTQKRGPVGCPLPSDLSLSSVPAAGLLLPIPGTLQPALISPSQKPEEGNEADDEQESRAKDGQHGAEREA